jgi:prepilin-type N-terminal cleavage/methylation domain-containing protein/prepilin-type processing-associated H-X9-DG protein
MNLKRAFTLIELLVVIAIIAILAAILFPVFSTAREKARQTSCASNEKQLGLAFIQYVQDFDERWPNGNGDCNNIPGRGWVGQLWPYIKAKGAVACPSDLNANVANFSYGYNTAVAGNGQSATYIVGAAGQFCNSGNGFNTVGVPPMSSQFTSPARTVLLYEMQSNFGTSSWTPATDYQSAASYGEGVGMFSNNEWLQTGQMRGDIPVIGAITTTGYLRSIDGRHNGGSNFVLTDGHVKWFKPNNVSAGQNVSTSPANYSTLCDDNTWPSNGTSYSDAHQGSYDAAGTGCADPSIGATFSIY